MRHRPLSQARPFKKHWPAALVSQWAPATSLWLPLVKTSGCARNVKGLRHQNTALQLLTQRPALIQRTQPAHTLIARQNSMIVSVLYRGVIDGRHRPSYYLSNLLSHKLSQHRLRLRTEPSLSRGLGARTDAQGNQLFQQAERTQSRIGESSFGLFELGLVHNRNRITLRTLHMKVRRCFMDFIPGFVAPHACTQLPSKRLH